MSRFEDRSARAGTRSSDLDARDPASDDEQQRCLAFAGWRLDTAFELGHAYLRELTDAARRAGAEVVSSL